MYGTPRKKGTAAEEMLQSRPLSTACYGSLRARTRMQNVPKMPSHASARDVISSTRQKPIWEKPQFAPKIGGSSQIRQIDNGQYRRASESRNHSPLPARNPQGNGGSQESDGFLASSHRRA